MVAISFDKFDVKQKIPVMKQTMLTLAILLNAYMLSACSINIGADRSSGRYERDAAGYGASGGVVERSLSVQSFTGGCHLCTDEWPSPKGRAQRCACDGRALRSGCARRKIAAPPGSKHGAKPKTLFEIAG